MTTLERHPMIPVAPPSVIENFYTPEEIETIFSVIRKNGPWRLILAHHFSSTEEYLAISGGKDRKADATLSDFVAPVFRGFLGNDGVVFYPELHDIYFGRKLLDTAPIQVSAVIPHSIRSEIFLSAQREAPTDNPTANAVFAAMQRDNVEKGLDPLVAAEHMVEQIARGEFWIHSDDDLCIAAVHRRAHQLLDLAPPADPQAMLTRMGITAGRDR